MIHFAPLKTSPEWAYAKKLVNPVMCEDSQGIMAYEDRGDGFIPVAVCVLDSFGPDSCSAHIGIENPFVIKHGFINEICRHVFHACGKQRLFGMVPADNVKALRFDRHIGMTECARIPNGYKSGVDYIIMVMEKESCRWIEQVREAA